MTASPTAPERRAHAAIPISPQLLTPDSRRLPERAGLSPNVSSPPVHAYDWTRSGERCLPDHGGSSSTVSVTIATINQTQG